MPFEKLTQFRNLQCVLYGVLASEANSRRGGSLETSNVLGEGAVREAERLGRSVLVLEPECRQRRWVGSAVSSSRVFLNCSVCENMASGTW